MHNIYFTRHGETVWNVENKICGMYFWPTARRPRLKHWPQNWAVRQPPTPRSSVTAT